MTTYRAVRVGADGFDIYMIDDEGRSSCIDTAKSAPAAERKIQRWKDKEAAARKKAAKQQEG